MFKLGKLENTTNEKITIINNKSENSYEYLTFNIEGQVKDDSFCFSFNLNCNPKKLLEVKKASEVDFKKYIDTSSISFSKINSKKEKIKDDNIISQLTLTRLYDTRYLIHLNFFVYLSDTKEYYSSLIGFRFNLDNYLKKTS